MKCSDVQKRIDLYVDGELDAVSASALRGHTRECSDCEALRVSRLDMVRELRRLPEVTPPDSLWGAIHSEIKAKEIADSKRTSFGLGWLKLKPVLPFALASVSAIALVSGWLVLRSSSSSIPKEARAPLATPDSSQSPGLVEQPLFKEKLVLQVQEAEKDYRETLLELESAVQLAKNDWAPKRLSRFEQAWTKLRSLEREAKQEVALYVKGESDELASRDQVYAVYQDQIDFLQLAALGDDFEVF